jgi:phosphoglycerol transferase MdoB-like AlkP superfamily enzyme
MKRTIASYIPANFQFIFLSLALLMAVNTLFRLILFFQNIALASNSELHNVLYSLLNRGPFFDLHVSLFILTLPFFTVSILFLANKNSNLILKVCNLVIIIAGVIHITVSVTDLGYFRYYNSRITNVVFNWTEEPGLMLKVMLDKNNNLPLVMLFVLSAGLYAYLQTRIFRKMKGRPGMHSKIEYRIIIFVSLATLMFFGIRGSFRLKKFPLNYKDAFFSDDHFLNQLGFNPVFHFGNSFKDTRINYFKNDDEFIDAALGYLERNRSNAANPFEMQVDGKDLKRPNIILIFLESMSNAMVSRYNPELRTTPFLDSLAGQGIVFDDFYSAGIHTHNAIFTTLYGLPAIMNRTPMNSLASANQVFHGLPWILKEKNFRTAFYITGSIIFDNMEEFLSLNGFDRIIGDKDYSPGAIYNLWGATDKTMFDRVLQDCDSLSKSSHPFFCSILTISSHNGYTVPSLYENTLTCKEYPYKLYEYADMQLKDFMNAAEKTNWFDNTVFVLVGDHGQNFEPVYDLNLNYHRVPLIFYSPSFFDHLVYNDPGLQEDIYPTLFGLLDFKYINNGMGVDLFKHKREFGYFSADNKLGVIDDSLFLVYRGKNNISLYSYKDDSSLDLYSKYPEKAALMLEYGFSMVQSANYLIEKKLTNIKDSL